MAHISWIVVCTSIVLAGWFNFIHQIRLALVGLHCFFCCKWWWHSMATVQQIALQMLLFLVIFRFDAVLLLNYKSKLQLSIFSIRCDQIFRQNNASMIIDSVSNVIPITEARLDEFYFAQIVLQLKVDHVLFCINLSPKHINDEHDIRILCVAHIQKDEFLEKCIDEVESFAVDIWIEEHAVRMPMTVKFTVVCMTQLHMVNEFMLHPGPVTSE